MSCFNTKNINLCLQHQNFLGIARQNQLEYKQPTRSSVTSTSAGNKVTGNEVGRSEKVTGDEPGTCKNVTGTEYSSAKWTASPGGM